VRAAPAGKGNTDRVEPHGHDVVEVLDVLQLIWTLGHALQVRSLRMSRELGVTGPQRLALRLVASERVNSPGALAARLVLHKSTVTGIVARLEQRGLLVRAPHGGDGRRIALAPTPAGRRLARPRTNTIEAAVARAIAAAGPVEVRHASVFLRRLADELLPPRGARRPRRGTARP
jgi:DNA-binding MarR family transcriptional regulator